MTPAAAMAYSTVVRCPNVKDATATVAMSTATTADREARVMPYLIPDSLSVERFYATPIEYWTATIA